MDLKIKIPYPLLHDVSVLECRFALMPGLPPGFPSESAGSSDAMHAGDPGRRRGTCRSGSLSACFLPETVSGSDGLRVLAGASCLRPVVPGRDDCAGESGCCPVRNLPGSMRSAPRRTPWRAAFAGLSPFGGYLNGVEFAVGVTGHSGYLSYIWTSANGSRDINIVLHSGGLSGIASCAIAASVRNGSRGSRESTIDGNHRPTRRLRNPAHAPAGASH